MKVCSFYDIIKEKPQKEIPAERFFAQGNLLLRGRENISASKKNFPKEAIACAPRVKAVLPYTSGEK